MHKSASDFFIAFLAINFLSHLLRYALFAGIGFFIWRRARHASSGLRKIQPKTPDRTQIRRELIRSVLAFAIFTAVGFVTLLLVFNHVIPPTKIYGNIHQYSLLYFFFSIGALIIWHDTYFYWAHRLMHDKRVFHFTHRVHHLSTNPNPLSAYAFNSVESVIEALGITAFIFVMPINVWALFIFYFVAAAVTVYGHIGVELYPTYWAKHSIGRWINTAVAHDFHHQTAKHNYGIYFLFWDRLMGTLDQDYESRFECFARRPTGQHSHIPI